MKNYEKYKNQVLPDALQKEVTTFGDLDNTLKSLKKYIDTQETVFVYCNSVEESTGKIELTFNQGTPTEDIIKGYVEMKDITYQKEHIGRSIACVDNVIGVKVKNIVFDEDGIIRVMCSRKEAVKEIHDKYNKDIKDGHFKEGLKIKGIVTGMDYNKAYVDIGGDVTAICGVADIAKVFIKEPSDVFKHRQPVELVVKKIYADPIKISLSRSLLLSGWESIDKKFQVGKIVPGIVKNKMATGTFIELNQSFEGLAENLPEDTDYKYGDRVKVSILFIDKKRKKIKLKIIRNW